MFGTLGFMSLVHCSYGPLCDIQSHRLFAYDLFLLNTAAVKLEYNQTTDDDPFGATSFGLVQPKKAIQQNISHCHIRLME